MLCSGSCASDVLAVMCQHRPHGIQSLLASVSQGGGLNNRVKCLVGWHYMQLCALAAVLQVWGPDQQPRSIRNAAHQPAGTQHPQQQQQHAPEQQQHPRQQLPQRTTQLQQPPQQTQQHIQHPQQQQPGQFLKGRPQPRPGTAAAAAAAQSGADSRHSGSFFEPPSPDVMSVLNQLSGRGPGPAAAAAAAAAGNRSTAGGILPHQQQRQQQQVWPQQGREQQGEVSPALSGAAMPPVRRQTGLGSMPPPPPRAPAIAAGAAGGHHASQQQQRSQHNSQQQQPWLAQNSHQQQWPHPSSPQQQPWLQPSSQEQHQHPAGSGGPAQYVKPPLQQQGQGQSLFQGLSQPNAVTPGPPSSSQTLNPGSARVGTGSQVAGAWPGSSRQQGGVAGAAAAAGGCGIGSRGLPARPSTAAALDEEDVEVDQNLVSAIFGSQVPRAQPPLPIATQQQQQGAAVSGALTGSLGRAHAPPAAAGVKPALSAISSLGSKHQQGAMLPPANKVPAQQQWGMQQQQQQAGGVSGGVLGKGGVSGGVLRRGGAGVLGGSLLGKRSAQLSLLDDLVAGDLDDF